jgi:23S rRNA (pseudouridine1915-N3)-methyltransferase
MYMIQKIKIIAVGKIKHDWINLGIQTYLKRLPGLTIIEIKDSTKTKEHQEIQARLKPHDRLIALTEHGQCMDSIAFAHWLQQQTLDQSLVFAIGGPAGIAPELAQAAADCLSLSPMTFTHDMARLLLVEQLYRAQNIQQNGSYHK